MFKPIDHLRPFKSEEDELTLETLAGQMYCPRCAQSMTDTGFSSAIWRHQEIVFICWCSRCGWTGEIVETSRMIANHPVDEPYPPLTVVT